MPHFETSVAHPVFTRRCALQAGAIGVLGMGMSELSALRAMASPGSVTPLKSVVFVFLTGGVSHQDTLDLKPNAPDAVRVLADLDADPRLADLRALAVARRAQ